MKQEKILCWWYCIKKYNNFVKNPALSEPEPRSKQKFPVVPMRMREEYLEAFDWSIKNSSWLSFAERGMETNSYCGYLSLGCLSVLSFLQTFNFYTWDFWVDHSWSFLTSFHRCQEFIKEKPWLYNDNKWRCFFEFG